VSGACSTSSHWLQSGLKELYLGRRGRPDHAALAHGQIRAIALDATSVYWTDGSGAIGKVAKP
jgi:hypothetical protein